MENADSPELQQKSRGVTGAGHLWAHVHLVVDRFVDPWVGQAWVKPAPNSSVESILVNTWAEGGAATQRKGN